MVQVVYFVEGIWKPSDPMTLHWKRSFGAEGNTITTNRTSPRFDSVYFESMQILDKGDKCQIYTEWH